MIVEQIQTMIAENWKDYELIDSGNGSKLERFGNYYLVRPENQALWKPSLPTEKWNIAHAVLEKAPGRSGQWQFKKELEDKWEIGYGNIIFWVKITPFGHIGVFPEQAPAWDWIREKTAESKTPLNILNLFGYTGGATMAATSAGSHVTHVDASKPAVTWASENLKLSGMEEKPVRWIVDDAIKFVKREIKREVRYDGIIMDPPKFGRGPSGEVWQFEESFVELMELTSQIISASPKFIFITCYAVPVSSITVANMLKDMMKDFEGTVEHGELTLKETSTNRLLPHAIFSRWSSK